MIVSVFITKNKAQIMSDLLMNTEIFGVVMELMSPEKDVSELRAVCRRQHFKEGELERISSIIQPFGKKSVKNVTIVP